MWPGLLPILSLKNIHSIFLIHSAHTPKPRKDKKKKKADKSIQQTKNLKSYINSHTCKPNWFLLCIDFDWTVCLNLVHFNLKVCLRAPLWGFPTDKRIWPCADVCGDKRIKALLCFQCSSDGWRYCFLLGILTLLCHHLAGLGHRLRWWHRTHERGSAGSRPTWCRLWRCRIRRWKFRRIQGWLRWRPTHRWLLRAVTQSSRGWRILHLKEPVKERNILEMKWETGKCMTVQL